MAGDDEELLRKFGAAISGLELSDLHDLARDLTMLAGPQPHLPERPELRRPQRHDLATYRVRVDLDHATPPIWRRLELRSDLPLDVVHQVLQTSFDWTDSHLHRFSLGGNPFDLHSQVFLCPYDVEEGEVGDEGGIPASDVRLDEAMQEPGNVLRYVYDYGDSWELTLRLEEVLPASPDAPSAVVVDGRRAAPPEDCGGMTDVAGLAEVLDDPAHLDIGELNDALRSPFLVLREHGLNSRLVDLVNRLRYSSVGDELADRMIELVLRPDEGEHVPVEALSAHRWFLDRAANEGIALTSAGYLKPADVEAVCQVVPAVVEWIGKNNRESHMVPLLRFRESLQSIGLLRKRKGSLLLTRAGAAAQRDPSALWDLLAEKLVPTVEGFEQDATLLLLAFAASSTGGVIPLRETATALRKAGWRQQDGSQVEHHHLYDLTAYDVLRNVSDRPASFRDGDRVSPAAAALALSAIRAQR